jgi:serine/threonine-protein kinase
MPTITEALSNEADWGAIDSDEWKMLSAIEPIVSKGLAVDVAKRYESAAEMERELVKAVPAASTSEVAAWVKTLGKEFIEGRDKIIAAEEASWRRTHANIATQPGRRMTPIPGELKRPSTADIAAGMAAQHPPAPSQGRGSKMIIGVLGALVVLLGVGVVFAMRGGEERPQPAAKPAPTEPATATAVEPAPPPPAAPAIAPEPTPAEPAASPAPEPAPVATTAEPEKPEGNAADKPAAKPKTDEPKQAKTEQPPIRRAPKNPAPRPAVLVKKQPKEKPAETAAPNPIKEAVPQATPAAAEKPKDDCNPPYYFEGQKKVFKPNCL